MTPEQLHEKILNEFRGKWDDIAKAFAESNVKWHADEWKRFIELIQEDVDQINCEEIVKVKSDELERLRETLKLRLKYCEEQNGRDSCKNCGLNEEDLYE